VAVFALAQHPRSVTKGAGLVAQFGDFGSVGVGGEACAAQVVTEEVFDGHGLGDGVFAHTCTWRKCRCGDSLCASKIILGDGGTCQFVVVARACPERSRRKAGGHTIDGLRHPVAITVKEEICFMAQSSNPM